MLENNFSGERWITKKIDGKYIIWIEESNQWLQLEEPAWYVIKKHIQGISEESVIAKIQKKYGLGDKQSIAFVSDVLSTINNTSCKQQHPYPSHTKHSEISVQPCGIYSRKCYKMNNKVIELSYETELLEYYIHHNFAHLEIHDQKSNVQFLVFNNKDRLILLCKCNAGEHYWSFDEIPHLKRRLFIELTNSIYEKKNEDWMTIIHASGLSMGLCGLLLCSGSGAGKSTLASLLHQHGFDHFSDDFVPLDFNTQHAWPFPAALSIKAGSFPLLSTYYPALEKQKEKKFRLTNKSIRFLPLSDKGEYNYSARLVTHIVFVKYNPEEAFNFRQVKIPEALKMFHEAAWVSAGYEHVKSFLKWFSNLKCFTLEYSDNQKAIQAISGLFHVE